MSETPKPQDHSQFLFYEKNKLLTQSDEDYKSPTLPFPIVDEEDFDTSKDETF